MSIKLKDLPISERPYEKLELYGAESLTNSELLAIIIKTGTKEETAVQLAQRILNLDKRKKFKRTSGNSIKRAYANTQE